MSGNPRCRGLSLLSGGLDSQLAVRVLERAGAHVEGVAFSTPFFDCAAARKAAAALYMLMVARCTLKIHHF